MASVGHVSLGIMYNQADRMRTWHRLHIYAHSLLLKRAPACTHDACKFSPAHQLVHSRHVSDGDMGAEAESACNQKREHTWTSLNLTHTFETVTFRFVCVCFFLNTWTLCIHIHTNRKWCQSLSPGRRRRLLRYRDSGFLFLSFFLSPAFTWTHTDRH